jgi:CheY-like chemotaxis protein
MPTVLIVDDHPAFRATARAVLESDGAARPEGYLPTWLEWLPRLEHERSGDPVPEQAAA